MRYGEAALADVLPSALAALGVAGEPNPLHLPDTARVVLLLVDGLGWTGLRRHADMAPYLAALPGRVLTAGFPSTTATSLASLGTGTPPGQHAVTGYSSYVDELALTVNWLAWRPVGSGEDLRGRLVPEDSQPHPTVFERAAAAGVQVSVAAPAAFAGSGLTRAVLRGGAYPGPLTPGDTVAAVAAAASRGNRSLVYCYLSELDLVGHVRGPDTDAWREQLGFVDAFAARLADRLPADVTLLVTADHGMVAVAEQDKVDFDGTPALQAGVAALAGEPRVRYVHPRPGATADVHAAWREVLGERAWVLTREQAVAAGWFGPRVEPPAHRRIGGVLAVCRDGSAVVRRRAESRLSALVGQHGALGDDELLVPLLVASGREGAA